VPKLADVLLKIEDAGAHAVAIIQAHPEATAAVIQAIETILVSAKQAPK
jgi:hypothetical protein